MEYRQVTRLLPEAAGCYRRRQVGTRPVFFGRGKMFCVAALDGPLSVSFKVKDEEFDEVSSSPGIRPAPYVARYKWVLVEEIDRLSRKEWEHYITQSYDLVKSKLPKKLAKQHGLL